MARPAWYFVVALWSLLSVQAWSGPVTVQVETYGAVADDGGDDTAAIRQAIALVQAHPDGGTVRFQAGTYDVAPATLEETTIFSIRGSNLTLEGAGRGATTLSMWVYGLRDPDTHFIEREGSTYSVGDVSDWDNGKEFAHRFFGIVFEPPEGQATATIRDVTIRDMRITGNAEPIDEDAWYSKEDKVFHWDISHKGITFGWGSVALEGILIENVEIDRFRGEIIYKGGTSRCEAVIRNCLIHKTPSSAVSGPGGRIENCEIYDCYNAAVETYLTNRSEGDTQSLELVGNLFSPGRNYPEWFPRIAVSIQNDPNWPGTHTVGDLTVSYNGTPSTVTIRDNVMEKFARWGLFTYGLSNAIIKDNAFRDFYGNAMALWAHGNTAWGLVGHFSNNLILRNSFDYGHQEVSPCIQYVSPSREPGSCLFVENRLTGTGWPKFFLSLSGSSPDPLQDNFSVVGNTGKVGVGEFGNSWGGKVSRPLTSGNVFEIMQVAQNHARLTRSHPVSDHHSPFTRLYTWDEGVVYGEATSNPDFDMQAHLDTFPQGYMLHLKLLERSDLKPITVPAAWWNDLDEPVVLDDPKQSLFLVKQGNLFRMLGYYVDE